MASARHDPRGFGDAGLGEAAQHAERVAPDFIDQDTLRPGPDFGSARLANVPRPGRQLTGMLIASIIAPVNKFALFVGLSVAQVVCGEGSSSLYDIPLKTIDGKETSLKAYKGKVLLVVNVASKCGLTPQYAALEALHRKFESRGFVVLGFPCNDFAGQEPGTNEEIKQFCSANYDVTFPVFDKLHVKGPERHPLYTALAGPKSPFPGDVQWNFGKFLISKDGQILKRFEPRTTPDSLDVVKAIEAALAAK